MNDLYHFCLRGQPWKFSRNSKSGYNIFNFLSRSTGNKQCKRESSSRINFKNLHKLVGLGDAGEAGWHSTKCQSTAYLW